MSRWTRTARHGRLDVHDRVLRLNPGSGEFTEYLLPRETNIRRVFADNSTTPVTFWVGNNHGASIIKLEPLTDNRTHAAVRSIDLWFSIGSLYTFLTVMRMDRVEDTTDVRFAWRPFRIRTIMEEMNNLRARSRASSPTRSATCTGAPRFMALRSKGSRPTRWQTPTLPTAWLWSAPKKAGARLCARAYRRWFVEGEEQVPNRTCRTRCARSARSRSACSRLPGRLDRPRPGCRDR